jgi:NAD(P)-dependent dehydrogenase (short-subunit alcohol dehydrogenase family)
VARLSGKVAIVTGGSNGIGLAIVRLFAREGARVVVTDRVPLLERPEGVGAGEVHLVAGDVSRAADCERVVEEAASRFGGLHVLVNNAAVSFPGTLHGADSTELWHRTLDTNLHGVFYMTKAALTAMMASAAPCSIINMSSIAAKVVNPAVHPAYAASKGALLAFTRFLAPVYAKHRIRCNAICPGAVTTPLWLSLPEGVRRQYADLHPLGPGEPDDVAHLALYLASDESKWVTGSVIDIDGGNLCAGGLAQAAREAS